MSDIVPASPLEDVLSKDRGSPPGDDPGITMIERPFLGYVNLRGDVRASVFTAAVSGVLGVAVPSRPNTTAQTEHLTLCWVGPDEWMVIVAPGTEIEMVTALQDAVGFSARCRYRRHRRLHYGQSSGQSGSGAAVQGVHS